MSKNGYKKPAVVCDVVDEGSSKRTAADEQQQIKTMQTLNNHVLADMVSAVAVSTKLNGSTAISLVRG